VRSRLIHLRVLATAAPPLLTQTPLSSATSGWIRRVRRGAGYLVLWTAVGALFATQSIVTYSYSGTRTVSGWRLLAFSLADWYVWALLAPGIVWLARRVSVTRHPWRAAAVHVPASILFVIARSMLRLLVGILFPPVRVGPPALMMSIGLHVFVYWAILAVAVAVQYSRMYRGEQLSAARLKTQLARAELGLLKMQLQPHFLFNTLNAISEQVHTDPEGAERMITQLSELLRHTIRAGNAHEISLGEELALLERYLGIQRARFAGRLQAAIDAAHDAMDDLVPNLVLQPLVENAIQHGIAPRASGGRVTITARHDTRRRRLLLEVRDDGLGLEAARARRRDSGEREGGVGIANTVARLRQLYGDDYGFTLRDEPGGGAVVTLSLPLHVAAIDPASGSVTLPSTAAVATHGA